MYAITPRGKRAVDGLAVLVDSLGR
jgi:hypothetical protein